MPKRIYTNPIYGVNPDGDRIDLPVFKGNDGQKGDSGKDGGAYVPSVSNDGTLSWTPTDPDMQAVPPVNIKGEPGSDANVTYENVVAALGFTPADEDNLPPSSVTSVNGKTGDVTLTATDVYAATEEQLDELAEEVRKGAYVDLDDDSASVKFPTWEEHEALANSVALKSDLSRLEQEYNKLRDEFDEAFGSGEVEAQVEEIDGAMMLNTGAAYSPMESWVATDYVDIGERTSNAVRIHATVYGAGSLCFYGGNKSFIGFINGTNAADYGITAGQDWQTFTVVVPNETRYLRLSGYKVTRPSGDRIQVIYESAGQKPWTEDIESVSDALNTKIDAIDSKIGETQYTNLVNPADVETSMYVAGATGAVSASRYFDATGFIALSANTKYYVGNLYCDGSMFAFYTDKKVSSFIASPDVTVTVISAYKAVVEVGASGVYCRWSINKSHKNDLYISDMYDYYVPFGDALTLSQIYEKKHRCHYNKVLVMGDSISTDAYGDYKKWVTMLMDEGYLPADTYNNSQHATGFVARYDNKPNDFITRIKAVQNPEQYDLVVVFGGINDYIQNKPFGSDADTDYLTYVKPAVKEFYNYLITNFINARIAVLTPLAIKESAYPNDHGTVNDYSDYYMSVIRKHRLPVLDLTYESGLDPNVESVNVRWMLEPMPDKYPGIHDGVHPTEEYIRKFLVPMIRGFLERI